MTINSAELILHPVRLRIAMALAGRRLSPRQLGRELADVPQATLYRQLNLLAAHGLAVAVEERRARGAVEKIYTLAEGAGRIAPAEAALLSNDDHARLFAVFVSSLLGDFARYAAQTERIDPAADGLIYNKGALYLSGDELHAVAAGLRALLAPHLANEPGGRRRRIFATALLPAADHIDESL